MCSGNVARQAPCSSPALPTVLTIPLPSTPPPPFLLCSLQQGERRPRLDDDEYYAVIDEFCQAVKFVWPNALLQVRLVGLVRLGGGPLVVGG